MRSLRIREAGLPDCEAGTAGQTSGGSLCGPPLVEASARGHGGNSCCGTQRVPGQGAPGRKKAPYLAEGPLYVWE